MIPVSTVPKAITAILTAVKARLSAAGETDVLVCVGTPMANDPTDIIQIASDVRRRVNPNAFVGSGGAGALEENYTIDVTVSCARQVATPQTDSIALSNRVWELVAYVENAVRTDPSLGDVVVVAWPGQSTGGKPQTGTGTTPGRVVTVVVPIHCEAVI